ncbi:MAG: SprT-like domain-containing protein [Actinomycetaceae bacterium]|nr:SprT-like domain-containing protein [Actinomycetaceae bacterium]
MDIDDAVVLARQLMNNYGLHEWDIRIDRAVRRAGMCREKAKVIQLSGKLIPLYGESMVRDIILHEIAHALVGAKHGHDSVWKAQARQLGAKPYARLPKDTPQLGAPWIGTCPQGHTIERFRRPQKPLSCAQCSPRYNPRYRFTWKHVS